MNVAFLLWRQKLFHICDSTDLFRDVGRALPWILSKCRELLVQQTSNHHMEFPTENHIEPWVEKR